MKRLIEDHGPTVLGALRAQNSGSAATGLIEEAYNDGLWRVWRSSATYSEELGTLRGWFFVIVQNCLRQKITREEARHAGIRLGNPDSIAAHEHDGAKAPSKKLRERLSRAFDALTPQQRAIVEADLKAPDGTADAGELAAKLETNTATIYAARSKARSKLRGLLDSFVRHGGSSRTAAPHTPAAGEQGGEAG